MMKYTISVSEDCSYAIIRYHVPIDTKLSMESGPKLLEKATEFGITRFLFDMRESPNIQSVTDNYYFAYDEIQDFGYPKNSFTAFIIGPGDQSHEFIINAFMNAGYNVARFATEEEAVQWLRSDPEE